MPNVDDLDPAFDLLFVLAGALRVQGFQVLFEPFLADDHDQMSGIVGDMANALNHQGGLTGLSRNAASVGMQAFDFFLCQVLEAGGTSSHSARSSGSAAPPQGLLEVNRWAEGRTKRLGNAFECSAYTRAYFARRLLQVATDTPGPTPLHYDAVGLALEQLATDEDEPDGLASEAAADERARSHFAVALLRHLVELRSVVDVDPVPQGDADALRIHGGLLAWDARFATWLDQRFGEEGHLAAEGVRTAAQRRMDAWRGASQQQHLPGSEPPVGSLWRLWCSPPDRPGGLRAMGLLAKLVWRAEIRPHLAGVQPTPAIVMPLFERIGHVLLPGGRPARIGERTVFVDAASHEIVTIQRDPRHPLGVPTANMDAIDALIQRGAERLGSLNAHRLVRYCLVTAHRKLLAGEDFRAIVAEGGWNALAGAMGLQSGKAADEIKSIAYALATLWFPLPDGGFANLWSVTDRSAVGQQRARVEIVIGTALLPSFASTVREPADRRLVPILDLPPLIGRPNDHSAQAALQLRVLAELRRRARELVTHGGILVRDEEWVQMATAATLQPRLLPRVLDRWLQDGEDGPAFLDRASGDDRYTLGDAHRHVREFLLEAGRREIQGQIAGKKRVARKRARLEE